MKIINTPIYTLFSLLSFMGFSAMAQTADRDTISREMVLEREYIPAAKQAKKTFFNPLSGSKSRVLKPLNFARNTYDISMNVRPHLFEPIENSRAEEPVKNAWHLRILGGYPIRYGANMGMLYKLNDMGSIEMAIDHLSQSFAVHERPSGYVPKNDTHDTSLGLKYNGKLDDRLFSIGLDVFNHLHTLYGYHDPIIIGTQPIAPISNPLYGMTGTELHFRLNPAPITLLSEWQYSLFGNIGYTSKQDVQQNNDGRIPEDPRRRISGLDVQIGGSLAYGQMLHDVNVGVDALLATNQLYGIILPDGDHATQLMSLDPYLSYTNGNFRVKAGARVQLLSFGPQKVVVSPKLRMKWDLHELLALTADADGGAEMHSMRDLYRINRYAQGGSSYYADDITKYRASLGIQVGNLNGFSAELKAGYSDCLSMYQWAPQYAGIEPISAGDVTEILTYFQAESRTNVQDVFVEADARYISPIGLQAALGVKYNKYTRAKSTEEAETTRDIVSGRPSTEITASLDYQILPSLTAHLNFTGIGGIKFISPNLANPSESPSVDALPFITEMDARLSYKIHPNIGLSIMGLNIFNQTRQRWLYYDRPGTSIVGAITFNF